MNIVTALRAEAAPLIDCYGLEADAPHGVFPVYCGEGIRLVVSGVGKLHAAAATGYLHAAGGGHRNEAWLNVGVAGHAHLPLGRVVVAARITDRASERSWYPPQVLELPAAGACLVTVDTPEHAYEDEAVYDMEAAGFYPVASRFSTGELVQSLKVISDNRRNPTATLDARAIGERVADAVAEIDRVIQRLRGLSDELVALARPPARFDEFTGRWHFTVAERHRLRRLLERWAVTFPAASPWPPGLERCRDGAGVLAALEAALEARPPRL